MDSLIFWVVVGCRRMDHRTAYGLDGINKIYRIEG
jgi:hypothetical protein